MPDKVKKPKGPPVPRNGRVRARVIENFRRMGRVDLATAAAGVDRKTHYNWLAAHPDYRVAFEAAREEAVDMLEDEAYRRAYQGTEEPIFNGGKRALDYLTDADGNPKKGADGKPIVVPAFVRRYSDQVLMFLLKGRRREIFGDKLVASGENGAPLLGPLKVIVEYEDKPKPE